MVTTEGDRAQADALDHVAKCADAVSDLSARRTAAIIERAAAIGEARALGIPLSRIAQVLDVTVERVRQMQRQRGGGPE